MTPGYIVVLVVMIMLSAMSAWTAQNAEVGMPAGISALLGLIALIVWAGM